MMEAPGYWGDYLDEPTWWWRHIAIIHAACMNSAEQAMKWLIYEEIKYKATSVVQYDRTLNGRK